LKHQDAPVVRETSDKDDLAQRLDTISEESRENNSTIKTVQEKLAKAVEMIEDKTQNQLNNQVQKSEIESKDIACRQSVTKLLARLEDIEEMQTK
jgi:hypothetical protein